MTVVLPQGGIDVSLVIPAYNEETRIGENLRRTLEFLHAQPFTFEVLVVDDGSQDQTVEVAREIGQGSNRLYILQNGTNVGKGAAVRSGMLRARGRYVFFSDVDLSVPIETLSVFLARLQEGYDVAIGTRARPGATIKVRQPLYREFLGKAYTALSRWILGLDISDFTCGFKGFRRDVALELFSRQRLANWSFDSELLFLAKRRNYRLLEIPVTWRNDHGTKVRLWKDVFTSFLGLLRIRVNSLLGWYQ